MIIHSFNGLVGLTVQSSAYRATVLSELTTPGRSLMKMMKKSGPKVLTFVGHQM